MKYYKLNDNIIRVYEDGKWEFSGPTMGDKIEGIPIHKCKNWKNGKGRWDTKDSYKERCKQISEKEAFIEML